MWFICSLAALLLWSGSDIFSKKGSRPEDKYSHWEMVIFVGAVMGVHALCTVIFGGVRVTAADLLSYLPASALYILSMILGYAGLRYIELSVSSPICNSSGAVAAVLCVIFLKQRLEPLQIFGVCLVSAGVLALGIIDSTESEKSRSERRKDSDIKYRKSVLAIVLPLLYCLLDALGTFADSYILQSMDEDVANTAYELTFVICGACAWIYLVVFKKQKIVISKQKPKIAAAIFETGGQLAYVYAIAANAAAAAPMISAYCAASVIWSRLFLKEKLTFRHYAAVGVTIAGIVILGIFDG